MTILDKIRSRGYWEVVIRPSVFLEKRVRDISDLSSIIEKSFVSLRGWDFPHINQRERYHIDLDWIGQEFEWEHMLSSWRFYQSGLFVHISGLPIDWRDQSNFWPADKNWKSGQLLGVSDAIMTFTEVFEFASRLSLTDAGNEAVVIQVKLSNIKGRVLYIESPNRWGLSSPFVSFIDEFPFSIELPRSDLIGNPREHAVEAANELFKRFGWDTTIEVLRSFQEETMRR